MNSKAQAAVTDALLLLLVVGILSTSLILFSIQYGKTVQNYISGQYIVDFQTTALKTILYSSVPRNAGEGMTVFDAPQVDYLLAVVKEDYLDDAALSPGTFEILRNASKIAFKPLSKAYDYIFFIQSIEDSKFVFIYLNSTKCKTSESSGRYAYCIESESVEYYCVARNFDNIQNFLESVGAFNPVSSGIKLTKIEYSGSTEQATNVSAIAELGVWAGASFYDLSGNLLLDNIKIIPPGGIDLNSVDFSSNSSIGCAPNNIDTAAITACPGVLVCKQITN